MTAREIKPVTSDGLAKPNSRRAVKAGVTAKLRASSFTCLDGDRLRPLPRLRVDVVEELRRRTEHAAAEDDLLRVEQAHQVRERHAPELHRLGNDLARHRVAAGTGLQKRPATARDVFAAYDRGDPVARKVITQAVEFWGMAVANLVSLFNPEKIIFGGGVFGPGAKLLATSTPKRRNGPSPSASSR